MHQIDQEILEILHYYKNQRNPQEQENLVSMLREIQELLGCIPQKIQELAAQEFHLKPTTLACLIKLYPSLKSVPYVHEITMCTGQRCQNKNSARLLALVKKELGISSEGISADGRVCLKTQNCLKKCKTSPNLLLDGVHHPCMNEEKILALLKNLQKS